MVLGFRLNSNSDVIICVNEENYNIGYNYELKFPLTIWLSAFQVSGINVFRDLFDELNKNPNLSERNRIILERALEIKRGLPMELGRFNSELSWTADNVGCFSDLAVVHLDKIIRLG